MAFDPSRHHRRSIRLKGYDYTRPGFYFITICTQYRKCLFGQIDRGAMQLNAAGRSITAYYWKIENKFPHIRCDEFICMPNHTHFIIEIHPKTQAPTRADVGAGVGANPRVRPSGIPNADLICGVDLGECVELGGRECPDLGKRPAWGEVGCPDFGERPGWELGEHPAWDGGEHPAWELGEHVGSPLQGGRGCPDFGEHPGWGGGKCPDLGEHPAWDGGEHVGSPLRGGVADLVRWFKTMTTNAYIRGVRRFGWPPFLGKLWQRNYWEHVIRDRRALVNIRNYIRSNPQRWQRDRLRPPI